MLDPLIVSRAIHFASTLVVGGTAVFSAFIVQPDRVAPFLKARPEQLMDVALALAVLSGVAWLVFLASRIAQTPVAEVVSDGTAWSVLTETQFGHVWEGRLLVAIFLNSATVRGGRIVAMPF
jgi:copper resistance protein D